MRSKGTDVLGVQTRYSEKNIEDWDFRHCAIDDPQYDVEADLFFGTHFTLAVAVESVRLHVIELLVDNGWATPDEDKQHLVLQPGANHLMKGMKSAHSRFSRDGRFVRNVIEAMRRENRKYGRLKVTILPPQPGAASAPGREGSLT